jgi:hypothetical protein
MKGETEDKNLASLGIDRHSGEGDTDVTINRSINPNATRTKGVMLVGSSLSSRVVSGESRRSTSYNSFNGHFVEGRSNGRIVGRHVI